MFENAETPSTPQQDGRKSKGSGVDPAGTRDLRDGGKREVVYRDDDRTEMWIATNGSAKAFARQLIRDGKTFKCEPCTDEGWSVVVYEHNYANRWEAE